MESVKDGFRPDEPSQILDALIRSQIFSSASPNIDRGVILPVLIGFVIVSKKTFYFATYPPHEFNLAEIGATAFADDEGQYPIDSSVPFRISVSGENLSSTHSCEYVVLSPSESEFAIIGLGKPGKSRRLTAEEVRKEKKLTSRGTRSESAAPSRESSPAGVACVPPPASSPSLLSWSRPSLSP